MCSVECIKRAHKGAHSNALQEYARKRGCTGWEPNIICV